MYEEKSNPIEDIIMIIKGMSPFSTCSSIARKHCISVAKVPQNKRVEHYNGARSIGFTTNSQSEREVSLTNDSLYPNHCTIYLSPEPLAGFSDASCVITVVVVRCHHVMASALSH